VFGSRNSAMKNLFGDIPADLPGEFFETLVKTGSVRVERIVSRGHVTAAGDWYDQVEDEFVVVLKGAARLEFSDGRVSELGPGDCLNIPAHERHKVVWTDETAETVWLVVHYARD